MQIKKHPQKHITLEKYQRKKFDVKYNKESDSQKLVLTNIKKNL